MKRIVVGFFIIGVFTMAAVAQSGRRVIIAPPPAPSVVEPPEEVYSESKPKKNFPAYPNLRRDK